MQKFNIVKILYRKNIIEKVLGLLLALVYEFQVLII